MSDNPVRDSLTDYIDLLHWRLDDDPGWFHYDALNKVEPLGRQLKPWEELDEEQRALITLHVEDMSLWRAEGKLDVNDAFERFQAYPELRELLA